MLVETVILLLITAQIQLFVETAVTMKEPASLFIRANIVHRIAISLLVILA
jgi:hypothetical protein